MVGKCALPATVFALVLALGTGVARAQTCADDPATCGRREFEAGIEAYRAGDYRGAAERFRAAFGHRAHPVVLFNLALAEAKLEQYVEALEHFDQVLGDAETPKEMVEQVRAEREIAERGVATIEANAGSKAEVTIDGRAVAGHPALAKVNPGEHRVVVAEAGRTLVDRTVRVRAGERLQLDVDRTSQVVVQPPGPVVGDKPPPPPRSGLDPLWFYAGAGVTAVLGGVTVWSALDTRRAFDDYERDLPKLSQSEVNQRVDQGHDKELRTNLLLAATGLAAVGTATLGLFVVRWGPERQGAAATLFVGPGAAAAVGRF